MAWCIKAGVLIFAHLLQAQKEVSGSLQALGLASEMGWWVGGLRVLESYRRGAPHTLRIQLQTRSQLDGEGTTIGSGR